VVRIYENGDLIHVEGTVDPVRDIEIINMELILADLQTTEKRLQTIEKDVKRGDKDALKFKELLLTIKTTLEGEKLAHSISFDEEEKKIVRELHLITMKPFLYVLNKQSGGKNLDEMNSNPTGGEPDDRFKKLLTYFRDNHAKYVIVDAKIEDELKEFEGEEKEMMRHELGAHDNGVDGLISAGYQLLGLETYLTTGEMETRAWTIKKGSSAPKAASAIHSDFEQKFIRAEVVAYTDLVSAGSFAEAKSRGLLRTEGKEYIVKDGDVIEFKI
jgi:GTP-binding protein YchF